MKIDGVFFRDEEKEVFRIQHIDLLMAGGALFADVDVLSILRRHLP
jgi:hypothetical protein